VKHVKIILAKSKKLWYTTLEDKERNPKENE
jgi:hypothetical protein